MPKTMDKRAQARRDARVQRAHTTPAAPHTTTRAIAATPRRRNRRGRQRGFLSRFPVASTLMALLVIGFAVLFAHQNRLGPWAPTPPKQAVCDLKTHHCDKAPIMTINPNKTYIATIHTARGNIVIQLDAKHTPIAANNFVFLANSHFYDNTYFWRVEAAGMKSPLDGSPSTLRLIQGGSVTKNGQDPSSVPGYTFKDETVTGNYTAGDVAMANAGPNTNGAQYFICTGDNSKMLSKSYTIFGHVTSGLDVALKMQPQDLIQSVTIQVK